MPRWIQRAAVAATCLLALAALARAQGMDRAAIVRALIERSQLLEDTRFTVPRAVWQQYLREQGEAEPAPVGLIAAEGRYELAIAADHTATLTATVRLRVFDPGRCAGTRVLSAEWAWGDLRLNGERVELPIEGGWLSFSPAKAGLHVVTARADVPMASAAGGAVHIAIPRTVQTLLRVDSATAWHVSLEGASRGLEGSSGRGTHGQLAAAPCDRLAATWQPPAPAVERPPSYQLQGIVAWNIDAGVQQLEARLDVAIIDGRTDLLELRLPPAADRVRVTGPDVREVQIRAGGAQILLRGHVVEQTRLQVSCEMPLARSGLQRLGGIGLRDGHWTGGTVVVANAAGGSEVVVERLSGLRETALGEIPSDASAMLAGPPAVACTISGRRWAAEIDVVRLGEFALRESIADLAHYEITFRGDGSLACKATYEVRNRTRQFVRLDLPPGAVVLVARVNEKPRPLTRVPDAPHAWLLPLIRSRATVKGLVTFLVEVVYLCRVDPLGRRGEAAIPLPRIDLPIAYAWCEAHVPARMRIASWAGPLRRVDRFATETAVATLGYGRGIAAEGYGPRLRPTAEPKTGPLLPATPPPALDGDAHRRLARNYYRAGKEHYERGDLEKAEEYLGQVLRVVSADDAPEIGNAPRLLANIRLARGKLALKSRAERAAGAEVESDVEIGNIPIARQQRKLVREGLEAAREGRHAEARAQLEAAETLSGKLIERGANRQEQDATLRDARKKLFDLRELTDAEIAGLRKQVRELHAQGRYQEALDAARGLLAYGDRLDPMIRKELEVIAVRAAQEKADELNLKDPRPRMATERFQEVRARTVATVYGGEVDRPEEWEARIKEAMGKKLSFNFVETPLQDVIAFISSLSDVTVILDEEAIKDEAPTVTLRVDDMPLESALNWVLKLVGLKRVLKDGAIFVSKPDRIHDKPVLRMYDVTDLTIDIKNFQGRRSSLATDGGYSPAGGRLDEGGLGEDLFGDENESDDEDTVTGGSLVERIRRTIAPGVWAGDEDDDFGPAPTEHETVFKPPPMPESFFGKPEPRVQRRRPAVVLDKEIPAWEAAIREALKKKVSFDFVETPLQDVVAFISSLTDVTFVVDHEAVKDEAPTVTLRVNDMATEQALGWIVKLCGLAYELKDEAVFITTPDQIREKVVLRIYDVSRLVDDFKAWKPTDPESTLTGAALEGLITRVAAPGTWYEGDEAIGYRAEYRSGRLLVTHTLEVQRQVAHVLAELHRTGGRAVQQSYDVRDLVQDSQEEARKLEQTVRDVAGGPSYTIQYRNGRIVVVHSPEVHTQIEDLLNNYRKARGPQVEMGEQIATQRAKGLLRRSALGPADPARWVRDKQFRRFVNTNYIRTISADNEPEAGNVPPDDLPPEHDDLAEDLGEALNLNLEQKVQVSSINLDLPASEATNLGAIFRGSDDGARYATVDEAQLRTLLELDAGRMRRTVSRNGSLQETLIGTEARLADGGAIHVRLAGAYRNGLMIETTAVDLDHDRYLLLDHGDYLTAVHAGPMQHWSEPRRPMPFVLAPQDVAVPRVGRLVKFEKTLVQPTDDLVLRAAYTWRGRAR